MALAVGGGGSVARAEVETLQQALVQAYQTNPGLQAQRAALRAVDEGVAEALSGWRPSVNANASAGTRSLDLRGQGTRNLTPRSVGVQVTQPVFRGFRTVAGVRAAEAQVKAQRALLQAAEQQLFLNVGTAYLDVLHNQAVLDLQQHNETVLREQLAATRDRFQVGEVTKTDVSQAEARLERATAARIQAEGTLANVRATYASLVGTLPGTLETPTLAIPEGLATVDRVATLAETDAPDVRAAAFTETAGRETVTVTEGNLLPEVNLVGAVSRGWDQSSAAPQRQDVVSAEAQLTVPLYRSGADYARTRAAKQTASQFRLELADVRRRARATGIAAWQALMTARAARTSDEAAVKAAELALEGVREESKAGTRTTLDVLNAEQEALDARVALVQARHDEQVGLLLVRSAVGILTAEALALPVTRYDPQAHHDAVRDAWVGLGNGDDQ